MTPSAPTLSEVLRLALPALPKVGAGGDRIRIMHRCLDGGLVVVRYAAVRAVAATADAELTVSRDGRTTTRIARGVVAVLAHVGSRHLHLDEKGWYALAQES